MQASPQPGQQTFIFKARDAAGSRSTGKVHAGSLAEATSFLRAKGLFPITVEPETGAKPVPSEISAVTPAEARPLSRRAAARFMARLSKLTQQQITVDRALGIMSESVGKDPVAASAASLRQSLREGAPLSRALPEIAGLDDPAITALVQGAEVSGEMAQALETASTILQNRLAVLRSVVTSLLYPAILMVIALISLGLIMIAIIPQFRPLIADRFDLVPPLGRLVFALSDLLSAIWPFLAAGLLIGGFALWIMARRGGLGPVTALAMRLPGVRQVVRRNQMTMALHILGELLTREITLSEALRVISRSAAAGPVREGLTSVSQDVESGGALSAALRKQGLVTNDTLEMIRIGEEAGNLPEMVRRAAVDLRDATARELERFLLLFQPALIIIVGLMVGVSLYALFSAIVSVNAISF